MYDKEGGIVLSKIYEDDEVVVIIAPNESQLKDIILNLLRKQPMTIKELHSILSGLASEDKIRHALTELMEEGMVFSDDDGRYFTSYV
ncbi:MAG: ArsR family transcriptional regulator [Pyrodictiaceae archaeon]